ncbi:hypothetical protein MBH78_21230 [Oceanimonas sp. NS1]|nr:hypothetical protein [Oceanimonas sp. NS1]
MKKKLFIHIGTGKTGSTAIQDFFFKNKNLFETKGLQYCTTGATENNHHLLCKNFLRNTSENNIIEKNIIKLREEIEQNPVEKFLISSEYFPGLTIEEIYELGHNLSSTCSIEVIVYLRRQDEFLESWYAQIMKKPEVNSDIFDLKRVLYKEKILDYEHLINKWETIASKIHVRPYEKSSFKGGSIYKDFSECIGIDIEGIEIPSRLLNPSLTTEQILLKKELFETATLEQKKYYHHHFYSITQRENIFFPQTKKKHIK